MRAFARLYAALDETTKTNEKVEALADYFRAAVPEDAVWAIHFLIGRRVKRLIEVRKLVEWAIAEAGVPEWIFGECYSAVGDLAETIALLLPAPSASTDKPLRYWVEERLLPLREWSDEQRRESLVFAWLEMDEQQRFVWNKLITGEFRVGVSQNLVVRGLAEFTGLKTEVVSHRLMGDWIPDAAFYAQLVAKETGDTDVSRPYPFFLAYPLEGDPAQLGDPAEWIAEWKWDGIRSQMIRRRGQTFVWSRGEELVTDRFPELVHAGALLPAGIAIDGEILPWKDGLPLPFAQMQRRIGRKVLGAKILADVPVVLLAYDLLEWGGEDIREWPIERRRERLVEMEDRAVVDRLRSDLCAAGEWQARESADGLHVRRLGRRRAGAVREGLLRADERRDRGGGCVDPKEYDRAIRAGAEGQAGAGVRTRVRGDSEEHAASVRNRRAVPAHGPMAARQEGG